MCYDKQQKEMDDAKQKEDFKGINMNDPSAAMKQFQDLLDKVYFYYIYIHIQSCARMTRSAKCIYSA